MLALMAAAMLAASCVVLTAAAPDQYAKVVAEVAPSEPPLRPVPVQLTFESVLASVMLFPFDPAFLAVTVTTAPLEVAETPAAAGQALIAAARFDARVEGLLLGANVPETEFGQLFDPAVPGTMLPHAKTPARFDPDAARKGPGAELVTKNELLPGV
jgi:hypothetical protein